MSKSAQEGTTLRLPRNGSSFDAVDQLSAAAEPISESYSDEVGVSDAATLNLMQRTGTFYLVTLVAVLLTVVLGVPLILR